MPIEPIEIRAPLKGFHEGAAYKDQPAFTTPSCLNVIDRDPVTDRQRITSRPGTSKYNASQVSGSNAIVEGLTVTRIDGRVTYTAVEDEAPAQSPAIVEQLILPGRLDCLDLVCDEQSNLYIAAGTSGGGSGINYVCKYNSHFQQQWLYALPMQRTTDVAKSVRIDEEGGIYAVITGSTAGPTLIIKLEETGVEFNPVVESWRIPAPNGGWWTCCSVARGTMYAVEIVVSGGNTTTYLHRYDQIDAVNPTLTWSVPIRTGATGTAEECYAIAHADDGAAICAIVDPDNPPGLNGRLEKFGPQKPDETTPATTTSAGSLDIWTYSDTGVGQGVKVKDGYVYSHGYAAAGPYVRKLQDTGTSLTAVSDHSTTAATHFKGASSLDVDDNGNVYATIDDAGGTDIILEKVNAAFDTTEWDITGDDLGTAGLDAMAIAVDPKYADSGATTPIAEFLYVGTRADATTYHAVHKLRIANVDTSDGAPRETFQVCVANGNIRKVTSSSVATPAGTPTLDATSRWIMAAAGLNVVLFTDGRQYKKLDLLNGTDGTVATWTPSTGEIPRRGRLLTIWQNAAFVAGFEENPHQWGMSAGGDFDDWDFFPAAEGPASAVLGSDSRAGLCPDIINALAPWNDDLLIVGGDHTIQRLTGHPRDNGVFDVVSDITGMAWGRPWCKDPTGALYFIGSTGGLFRLAGGGPEELSVAPLSDRFRDIDIGANRFRLVWDHRLKGIWTTVTPYSAGASTHFFWSTRSDSWWPIKFAAAAGAHNPMSLWVSDGDAASDRVILLGCADGYVRKFGEAAKDDDGTAIDSWVYLPVLMPLGDEGRLNDWRAVLANGSDDVTMSVYALESADFNAINTDPLDPASSVTAAFSATLSAGRNDSIHEPVRGNAVLVRLRNDQANRRWGLESLMAMRSYAGRSRNR
jgi:hypothetical protein